MNALKLEEEDKPVLSVVIPVYNSENIFPELYRRLSAVLNASVASYEVVAVVDGCRDRSFEVISELAAVDPRIKVIEFARNFGHQAAVTAGLAHARGDWVGIMDDDLEDPPEVIPKLIEIFSLGYDVVYGVRRQRKRSVFHRFFYAAFYRVLANMTDVDMPSDAGDFCVMRRCVVDVLNAMPENNRYLRGMRAWVGFRQIGVEYVRDARFADESGYSFSRYFALAADAIFSFSYKPLKYVSIMGVVVAFVSFLAVVYLVYLKLSGHGPAVSGWASLLVTILMLAGVQLISVGILGQYLMRIYDEVKKRPTYVVRRKVNMDKDNAHG